MKRLENKEEWKQDDYTYFNIYNPEFTITIEDDEEDLTPQFYSYAMANESTMFQMLNVNYFGTKLYCRQVVVLDGGRYATPVPEWEFLHFGEYKTRPDNALKYFTRDNPSYKLNEFLYDPNNNDERYARQRFFEVVLFFEDIQEKDEFIEYVHSNEKDFIEKVNSLVREYSWIESNTKRQQEQIVLRLKTGKALNKC